MNHEASSYARVPAAKVLQACKAYLESDAGDIARGRTRLAAKEVRPALTLFGKVVRPGKTQEEAEKDVIERENGGILNAPDYIIQGMYWRGHMRRLAALAEMMLDVPDGTVYLVPDDAIVLRSYLR